MKKFLSCLMLLGTFALSAHSEPFYDGQYNPNQGLSDYLQKEDAVYSSSIIYVFYNSQTCDTNCPHVIELIESVYDEYFMNQYQFFVIDYFADHEFDFIAAYDLQSPLAMVLQKVENGEPTAYRKYPFLENQGYDEYSFKDNIKQSIEYFF